MSAVLNEEGLTPEERVMRSRLAAHVMHSKNDPREVTRPARAAFMERFRKQVDPDGLLASEERERRAQHALKAYMLGLALRSALARRRSE